MEIEVGVTTMEEANIIFVVARAHFLTIIGQYLNKQLSAAF
jgi:hypothetical protein